MKLTRKRILAGALTLAAVAAAATVSTVVLASTGPDEAEQAVSAYLEALRAKDLDTAQSYMADEGIYRDGDDSTLLTSEALSEDWEVVSVQTLTEDEQPPTVEAVIAAGERTAAGVFALTLNDDGDLKITNPYVRVWLPAAGPGTVSVNGFRADRPDSGQDFHEYEEILFVYPGSYTWFAETPGFFPGSMSTQLLLPNDPISSGRVRTVIEEAFPLPESYSAEADTRLAELIDDCARTTEIRPAGCPFNVAPLDPISDEIDFEVGFAAYVAASDPAWEIVAYPEVEWWFSSGGIVPVSTAPGTVELAITGHRHYSDDADHDLLFSCAVELEDVWARIGADDAIEVGAETGWSTCEETIKE